MLHGEEEEPRRKRGVLEGGVGGAVVGTKIKQNNQRTIKGSGGA